MPVGAGSLLLGCYLGFKELVAAGQIDRLPRLFAAQPLNCSPVEASFAAGVDTPVGREVRKTIAEGAAIRRPRRLREMIQALRESGGGAVAIREDEIVAALRRLAASGLLVEPDLGHRRRCARPARRRGRDLGERHDRGRAAGSGLKAAQTVADLVGRPEVRLHAASNRSSSRLR